MEVTTTNLSEGGVDRWLREGGVVRGCFSNIARRLEEERRGSDNLAVSFNRQYRIFILSVLDPSLSSSVEWIKSVRFHWCWQIFPPYITYGSSIVTFINKNLFYTGKRSLDIRLRRCGWSALDGLGDFKIRGQIIQTVKYADELVLMTKEETVLQGKIDKLTEIGRCYGMEMKWKKSHENFKTVNSSNNYDKSKTTGECGTF